MTSEICANCGYPERCHPLTDGESGYKCEKFIPSQGMTQEVPQNHSPQTNTRKVIVSGDKTEDTEPDAEEPGNSLVAPETEVQILPSGSDDASSLSDKIHIEYGFMDENKELSGIEVIPKEDVKESVKKLKDEFWVNEVIIARIDKIFGSALI